MAVVAFVGMRTWVAVASVAGEQLAQQQCTPVCGSRTCLSRQLVPWYANWRRDCEVRTSLGLTIRCVWPHQHREATGGGC